MTKGRMATMVENEGRAVDDQELVIIEGEEKDEEEQLREEKINENEKEKEGEQKNNSEKEINVKEKEEKEKEKNEKNSEKDRVKRTKSELAHEKKNEAIPCTGKEVPYPLVPSKKDKARHLA